MRLFSPVAIAAAAIVLACVPASPQTPVKYSGTAWQTLEKGLDDGDAAHRRHAIAATATLGALPRAVQLVTRKLQDKDALVRKSAAEALGVMGSPDAIPSLREALDDHAEVSFAAAKSLWSLGDSATAREIFVQVLAHERKDTPGKLQGALRDAKHKLRPEQLAFIGAKAAAGPGAPGVDAIEEILKQKGSAPGRASVAELLADDTDPYGRTLLEWVLSDTSPEVRLAAAEALGRRGNAETIPKLIPLLSDDRHAVRYMAAASIVRLADQAGNASRSN